MVPIIRLLTRAKSFNIMAEITTGFYYSKISALVLAIILNITSYSIIQQGNFLKDYIFEEIHWKLYMFSLNNIASPEEILKYMILLLFNGEKQYVSV